MNDVGCINLTLWLLVVLVYSQASALYATDANKHLPEIIHVDKPALSYLASDDRVSLFVSALMSSTHWATDADIASFFVPENQSLQADGSAFLLEIVLPKPENKERLDNLLATHVSSDELQLDAFISDTISTFSATCLNVTVSQNAIKIGPEASVSRIVKTLDGTIYYINHLLWSPYKQTQACH